VSEGGYLRCGPRGQNPQRVLESSSNLSRERVITKWRGDIFLFRGCTILRKNNCRKRKERWWGKPNGHQWTGKTKMTEKAGSYSFFEGAMAARKVMGGSAGLTSPRGQRKRATSWPFSPSGGQPIITVGGGGKNRDYNH